MVQPATPLRQALGPPPESGKWRNGPWRIKMIAAESVRCEMSEADALRSLLARLEAGEQPSIALDVALWEAFGRLKLDTDEPPLRSLDAAVALCERVKPGWAWDVMFESERLLGTASPHKAYWGSVRRYRTSFDKDHIGHAATPALALCIAVVKAKLAEVEQR